MKQLLASFNSTNHSSLSTLSVMRFNNQAGILRQRVAHEGEIRIKHLQVGAPLHPRNVVRVLHRLLKTAKLPRVRFHDLRHSAANLLIASGVPLIEVSQLLGHSELCVTADLYTQLQTQTAAKAATLMDRVLG